MGVAFKLSVNETVFSYYLKGRQMKVLLAETQLTWGRLIY